MLSNLKYKVIFASNNIYRTFEANFREIYLQNILPMINDVNFHSDYLYY